MMAVERILCGPWCGEFGWELLHWQGYLRKLAERNRHYDITVLCEPGHDYLYTDFAHAIIHQEFSVNGRNGFLNSEHMEPALPEGYDGYVIPFDTTKEDQHFIRLGAGVRGRKFDCMVHARDTTKGGDLHKNWWENKWNELVGRMVNAGMTVGAYGSPGQALCPAGAVDMRSAPMRDICASLAVTGFAVGTTSGGMNLASLCGTPTVIWGGGDGVDWTKNRKICAIFNAGFEVVSESWQPSVDDVWGRVVSKFREATG